MDKAVILGGALNGQGYSSLEIATQALCKEYGLAKVVLGETGETVLEGKSYRTVEARDDRGTMSALIAWNF